MRRLSKIFVPVIAAIIPALVAGWYMFTIQTRKINSVIREIQEGIRQEDVSICLGYLSGEYQDEYGNRINDIIKILQDAFRSFEDINVIILDRDIRRNGDEALAGIEFRVVATLELGVRGYIIGDMKEPAHVEVRLKRIDRRWQITGISRIRDR